jgi:hypothetical protein
MGVKNQFFSGGGIFAVPIAGLERVRSGFFSIAE